MLNSQITLTLFFLYVVIISDKFFDIISCRLQRLITVNIYIRHFFIFMNIFLFTFILGWYTEFSIFDAKQSFDENTKRKEEFKGTNDNNLILDKLNIKTEGMIILKYIGYSFLIYVIFLLTTKCELEYLLPFLLLILGSFIIFILKTYGKKKQNISSKLALFEFISKKEKMKRIRKYLETNNDKSFNEKQTAISKIHTNYILTNLENTLFILSLLMLVIGVLFYLKRKQNEYGANFNYIIFIFGTLKCKKKKKNLVK